MSLVSQPSFTNPLIASPESHHIRRTSLETTEATLGSLLGALTETSQSLMDRSASSSSSTTATTTTYPSQSASRPSFSHALPESQSAEETPTTNVSSAPASASATATTTQYTPSPGVKSHSNSPPDYGVYPSSARSGSFPEHIHRQSHPASSQSGGSSGGGMPQSASPSLPLQDGRPSHQTPQIKSDPDVPIDPSIAASSPTYPPHSGQYSPYPPQQEMSQAYSTHPAGAMYTQPRPDWAGYAGHPSHPQHAMQGGYAVTGAQNPSATAPVGVRSGQVSDFQHSINGIPRGYSSALPRAMQSGHPYSVPVYSFVPIPGAQQHKRPRRRYEEIERMYKCGWNGCEKAYGTLNHLNAHVTMQSHGTKRTPEEFKEIRKEWKARKKEEENQRKADEDRNRAVAPNDSHHDGSPASGYSQQNNRSVQLPPIGYQPGTQVSTQYQSGPQTSVQQIQQEFNQGQLSYSGYPASPYGAPNQMYNQHYPNFLHSFV